MKAQKVPGVVPWRPRSGTRRPIASKDFLSVLDLTPAELERVLELAARLKAERGSGSATSRPLEGQHVALVFEKPSLRTRKTFVIAVRALGGELIEATASV